MAEQEQGLLKWNVDFFFLSCADNVSEEAGVCKIQFTAHNVYIEPHV